MKKSRFIPLKNYLMASAIIIGSILLSLYIFSWYNAYQEKIYSKSYLVENDIIPNEITSIKELKNVLSETPNEYFMLISYTGDKDTYKLEKSLKKIINEYELGSYFYYLNVTDIKDHDKYLDEINNTLNLTDVTVKNVPTIIYFKNNTVTKDSIIVREDDAMMNAGDFQKLLDVFQVIKP